MNPRLVELREKREKLQQKLIKIEDEIIQLKTSCDYKDSKICAFVKHNTSYVCKICSRIMLHN